VSDPKREDLLVGIDLTKSASLVPVKSKTNSCELENSFVRKYLHCLVM
jgi:hypothetical protein